MASITKELVIDARPEDVWDALRDFGGVHSRLVAGLVIDAHLDGGDRVITFFNGAVARERLITIDEEARRLVYSVVDSPLHSTHDNSSAQVFVEDDDRTRFVWIKDVLPDELAPRIAELMDNGMGAIQRTLESQVVSRPRQ
jgi:hypothetical protein